MADDYVPARPGLDGFNCPHCEAYAHQTWYDFTRFGQSGANRRFDLEDTFGSVCERCEEFTIWIDGEMIHPPDSPAPLPSEDMPESVRGEFEEARQVVSSSPRAAAALLRLAVEKLTEELDAEGDTLHIRIGNLVSNDRIDQRIQRALDSVRVIGNESVHPGVMDMEDDIETAAALFGIVNTIVRVTISDERAINEMYASIPESKRDGIEQRDGDT